MNANCFHISRLYRKLNDDLSGKNLSSNNYFVVEQAKYLLEFE